MALTELRVEIDPAGVDAAEEILFEESSGTWTVLEEVPARRAWLVGIFGDPAQAWAAWRRAVGCAVVRPLGEPVLRELAEREWRESYKAHFQPSRFGRLHWVPVWEKGRYAVPPGDAALWLDPGLAFGTGNHETTRLCCERLVALAQGRERPGNLIDAGTGSGILALSGALLGFRPVFAFDHDPEAVRVSGENAAMNGLEGAVEFAAAELAAGLCGRTADAVVANIQSDVLSAHARELAGAVSPGGTLVLSGILSVDLPAVRVALAPFCAGWRSDSRTLGEWSDLALTRS